MTTQVASESSTSGQPEDREAKRKLAYVETSLDDLSYSSSSDPHSGGSSFYLNFKLSSSPERRIFLQ